MAVDVHPTGAGAMHQLIIVMWRYHRARSCVGAIQVHIEFTGVAAVEPLLRLNLPTDIAGKSLGTLIRILESEVEVAGGVGLDPDLERLGGAGDVEIVLAAGAVVVPGVAGEGAGVAAEPAAGVGGDGEEGEVAAAVGGVGDELREVGAGLVEGEVAGRACVHDSTGLEVASGTQSLRVVERERVEIVGVREVLHG